MFTSLFDIKDIFKLSKALFFKVFLLVLLVFSPIVNALTLGEFKVDSYLDKPLQAEIDIKANSGDNLDTLVISMASDDEFKQAGIDRIDSLQDFKFEIEKNSDKNAKIIVTSDKLVSDPYVHMLLKLQWNGGQLLREFTALIDPPLYSSEPASVVEAAKTGVVQKSEEIEGGAAASQSTQSTSTNSQVETSQSASTSEVGFRDGSYGPVTGGSSLGEVAQEIQNEYSDLSIYQIMLALYRDNPEAFLDNNINGLLEGSVLDVADSSNIRELSRGEGVDFFYSQLAAWTAKNGQAASNTESSGGSSSASESATSETNEGQSNSTSSSKSSTVGNNQAKPEFQVSSSNIQSGASSNGKAVEGLKAKIADLEASFESSKLENEELRDAISILENQLADSGRLIELNNQELASLQSQQKEIKPELVQPLKGDVEPKKSAIEQVKPAAVAKPKPVAAKPKPVAAKPKPVVAKPKPKQEKTLVDQALGLVSQAIGLATSYWKELLGLIAILGLGIGFLVKRAKSKDEEEEFEASFTSYPEGFDDEVDDSADAPESSSKQAMETQDTSVVSSIDMDALREATQSVADFEVDSTELPDTTKESSFLTVYNDGDVIVNADEIDPIAEADVYIAYGREDQGEEVLLDGVKSFPDRVDIKIALLGLYVKSKQRSKFEDVYSQLSDTGLEKNIEDWQAVDDLRKSMDLAVPSDTPLPSLVASNTSADEAPAFEEEVSLDMAATQILSSPLVEDTVERIIESKSVDVDPSSSQLDFDVTVNSIIDELSEVDINDEQSLDISEIDFSNNDDVDVEVASLDDIEIDLSGDANSNESVSPSVQELIEGDEISEIDFSEEFDLDGEINVEEVQFDDAQASVNVVEGNNDLEEIDFSAEIDSSSDLETELDVLSETAALSSPDLEDDISIDIDDISLDISALSDDLSLSFDANEEEISQVDFSDQSLTEQYSVEVDISPDEETDAIDISAEMTEIDLEDDSVAEAMEIDLDVSHIDFENIEKSDDQSPKASDLIGDEDSEEVHYVEEDSVESELSFDFSEVNDEDENELGDIDLDLGVPEVDLPDGSNDPQTQLDLAKVFLELDDVSGAVNILKDLTEDDLVGAEAKDLLSKNS